MVPWYHMVTCPNKENFSKITIAIRRYTRLYAAIRPGYTPQVYAIFWLYAAIRQSIFFLSFWIVFCLFWPYFLHPRHLVWHQKTHHRTIWKSVFRLKGVHFFMLPTPRVSPENRHLNNMKNCIPLRRDPLFHAPDTFCVSRNHTRKWHENCIPLRRCPFFHAPDTLCVTRKQTPK